METHAEVHMLPHRDKWDSNHVLCGKRI